MGKEIGRRALEGRIASKAHEGDGDTQGLPAGNRGTDNDNKGKSIKDFRVGRGAV